jgi:cyclophilin family peptidyl-prolyl cis-trans isomerase
MQRTFAAILQITLIPILIGGCSANADSQQSNEASSSENSIAEIATLTDLQVSSAEKVCDEARRQLTTLDGGSEILLLNCEAMPATLSTAMVFELNSYVEWSSLLQSQPMEDLIFTIPLSLVAYSFGGSGVVPSTFDSVIIVFHDDNQTVYEISPSDLIDVLDAQTAEDAQGAIFNLRDKIKITTLPAGLSTDSNFSYGTTECPPADGTAEQTQEFSDSFALCIDSSKIYTAVIKTHMGSFSILLDATIAPGTVNNFVSLARNKYFDGTICHRAIPGFVVQCGDPTGTGIGEPGYSFSDELPPSGEYKIGSLAMANSGPNTNGSQFFVITGDQGVSLPPNYTLFGQVTEGLDATVVALDAAGNDDPSANGVPPLKEIKIESITITES